jgi:hypothetical protein
MLAPAEFWIAARGVCALLLTVKVATDCTTPLASSATTRRDVPMLPPQLTPESTAKPASKSASPAGARERTPC